MSASFLLAGRSARPCPYTRHARRLKAGAGACAAGWWCLPGWFWPGQDQRPVDQPKAVTAQQLIGGGPVPGERISDLASVSYLADDLFSGPPNLHRSTAVSVAQGVAGEFADGEHQVRDARRREPGALGLAGDEAANRAQVVTVVQRLGARGRAGQRPVTRGGTFGGPRYVALAVSSPPLMTAGCVLAASAMTDPGSPVLS